MIWHRKREEIPDQDKIQCVYQQYVKLAYYIAFGILQHREDAEDAVQETFIRIMKNISKISDPICPETKNFVVIICKNISLDMLKRRKHNKEEELPDYIPVKQNKSNPYVIVGGNETIQIVVDAVHELPDMYKDCMYMELVLEFNYKEIADILKQKPETVRKRLQRGKKLLQMKLEERGMTYGD